MERYDHTKIEGKWQKRWAEAQLYASKEDTGKPKTYVLDMFPYPSGEGLHVGHPKGYIATDIYSRFKRMQGREVLHPMGWDAFGLPAENYALKNKVHPRVAVEKNIATFKDQLALIGFDYDWTREINTTDPAYYTWTQWIFLQLFKKGLAYQSNEPINWCPSCMTGLANEDLDGNVCERCGTVVEKRRLPQWVLKITAYADRMLTDLDLLEWPEHIKTAQRNWIGKSEGAEIGFEVKFKDTKVKPNFVLLHGYTGRADKNFIPWLKKNLELRGYAVQAPQLPNTDNPTEAEQVGYVFEKCSIDENTIIVGHSLGGTVAMKVIEKLTHPITGLVLVAPAKSPEFRKDSTVSFSTTFSWDFDYQKIKSSLKYLRILSDSIEAEHRMPYLRHLAEKFGVSVTEVTAQEEHFCAPEEPAVLEYCIPLIRVFTTRADTLFGATFLVLAPEHPWVTLAINDSHDVLENKVEVKKYVQQAAAKTEIERTAEGKEKTGVELKGVKAINPANGEEVPMFVADYVLGQYGTGAIMAVPAHDDRDAAFAKKFNIPVRQVVAPYTIVTGEEASRSNENIVYFDAESAILKHWSEDKFYVVEFKNGQEGFIGGHVEEGEKSGETIRREIAEESGYTDIKHVEVLLQHAYSRGYKLRKSREEECHDAIYVVQLGSDTRSEISDKETDKGHWMTADEILHSKRMILHFRPYLEQYLSGQPFTGEGKLVNSGTFDGLMSAEAKQKITETVGGKTTTTYKIKDWVFSRQRYWGEPIPIIHCPKDGAVAVPEDQLPVLLPDVESYEPSGTGESPLATITDWVNTTCPTCGGPAKRETNTMPQWAGSSWYYLRFMDPHNDAALVSKEREKYWAPVDVYVGGDHAVRHLIYARFWHKFLYDIGSVSTVEPFARLEFLGFILAEDGRKMSKRYGNVINPTDVVHTYGADAFRTYEMFMGPFENTVAWSTASIAGTARFMERVWKLGTEMVNEDASGMERTPQRHSDAGKPVSDSLQGEERLAAGAQDTSELEAVLHQTIKKVSEDIEAFKFNTAVSQMMIFLNAAEKSGGITTEQWEIFLRLLAPFAPHITDELWEKLGHSESIHIAPWPTYDPTKTVAQTVTVAIQINGKVRATVELPANADQDTAVAAARAQADVASRLEAGKEQRVIYVPGKIVNFVVLER